MPSRDGTVSAPIKSPRSRSWSAIAAAVAATALAFHPFWNRSVVFRDSLQTFAPYKALVARSLAAGETTTWYPWSFLGMPFVGNVEAGWYYPLNLLYVVLPFEPAHRLFILVHYPLAAVFMMVFLRGRGLDRGPALLGGLAYALSGAMVCQHATVTMLIGAAWAPLALTFAARALQGALAWAVAAGGVIALQVYAGDPQTALVTATIVAVSSALAATARARRSHAVGVLTATAVSSALLSAAQSIPTWDLMRRTVRGAGIDLAESTIFSFHPGRIVELVWPTPFGALWPDTDFWGRFALDGPYDNPWSITNYMGLPVIALAVIGVVSTAHRGGRRLALAAGAFFLVALGGNAPVYGLMHRVVPLFDLFRYPEKFMVGVAACVAIAAALGLQSLVRDAETRPTALERRARMLLIVTVVLLGLGLVVWPRIVEGATGQGPGGAVRDAAIAHLRAGGIEILLVGLVVGGIGIAVARKLLDPRAAYGILLAVLVVDWSVATVRRMPTGPADLFDERPLAATIIAPQGRPALGGSRVFREAMKFRDLGEKRDPRALVRQRVWERETLVRNIDAMEGFEDLVGYSSSKLLGGLELLKSNLTPPMLETLNVGWVLSAYGRQPIEGVRSEVVYSSRENDLTVTRLPDARPRAYWVPTAIVVRDDREAIAALRVPERAGLVAIQDEPDLVEPDRTPAALLRPARVVSYEPERVVVESDADRDGWLVLSDRHDPGWVARVDDEPAPIRRANVLVRAVRVPSGRHLVTFEYRPIAAWTGCAMSALAWVAAFAWWGLAVARWRKRAPTVANADR